MIVVILVETETRSLDLMHYDLLTEFVIFKSFVQLGCYQVAFGMHIVTSYYLLSKQPQLALKNVKEQQFSYISKCLMSFQRVQAT